MDLDVSRKVNMCIFFTLSQRVCQDVDKFEKQITKIRRKSMVAPITMRN